MEQKKTAVEWLQEQYNQCPQWEEQILEEDWEKAKEMEKEQMIEFAKKWGLIIEERELSYTERYDIHKKYITEDKLDLLFELATNENLDKLGVPTKLITITYNNKTIISYNKETKKSSYVVTKDMLIKKARYYGGGKQIQIGDEIHFGFVMNSANIYGNTVTKLNPEKDYISMSMHEFVLDKSTGMLYQIYSKD